MVTWTITAAHDTYSKPAELAWVVTMGGYVYQTVREHVVVRNTVII